MVNNAIGEIVTVALLHRVMQNLLKNGIPVRNLAQILESVSDNAPRSKDPAALTELVRKALERTITAQCKDGGGKISAITMEPSIEYGLISKLAGDGPPEARTLDPETAANLSKAIGESWKDAAQHGHEKTIMLCDPRLRPHLAAMLSRQLPQLSVVAFDEIALGTDVESVGTVTLRGLEAQSAQQLQQAEIA